MTTIDEVPELPSPSPSTQRIPSRFDREEHPVDPDWDHGKKVSLAHATRKVTMTDAVVQIRELYQVRERWHGELLRQTRRRSPAAKLEVARRQYLKARFRLEYALGVEMFIARIQSARGAGWITPDIEVLRRIGYLG